MPKPDPMLCAFGKNVRTFRERQGLTQVALAQKANIDRSYLCDVERGREI
jgi:transcriptional regulator with XRE-family HTH domain